MTIKAALFCTVLGLSAAAAPSLSNARVFLDVDIAPPPPQEEVVPPPRVGFVWAPGYWDYDGHHHHWTKGHWEHEHHGSHWVADRWDHNGDKWHHERGHWDRD